MASGTVPTSPASPTPRTGGPVQVVEYGQFIEDQLQKTRSQVKWVEVASGMMTLLAGLLAYLLLVAVVDAWVVRSGLGTAGRWLCLVLMLGAAATYFVWAVLPVCLRRINPVYAAFTIERSRPTLKNSVINFLLLRSSDARLPPVVYQAVEQKAATDLSQMPVDAAVDRSRVVKLGYLLVALVAFAAAYKLLSPRDPLRSVGRLVFPWADLPAPTRVTIEELAPGDAEVFHGGFVDVSAVVHGVDDDEAVSILYSTADGQTVDRAIDLKRPLDGYRHVGVLPAMGDGLQQDVEYFLRAGDAVSRKYHVRVLPAPAIQVKSVELEYPAYSGLTKVTQDRGDIKALEGTTVTIHARANQPITSAGVDFDCDGSRNLTCSVNGADATVRFVLRLKDDRQTPEYAAYQLRFTNQNGVENPQPIRHTIEVVADLPPEVAILAPVAPEVELPRNGALAIGVRASDPDYALSRVTLHAEVRGSPLFEQVLLEAVHNGTFHGEHLFDAGAHNLRPGDEVVYWAEAHDSKSPQANMTASTKQRIKIVDPLPEKQRNRQVAEAKKDRDSLAQGQGRPNPPRDRDDPAPRDESDSAQPVDPQDNRPAEDRPKEDQQEDADRPEEQEGSDPADDQRDPADDKEPSDDQQQSGEEQETDDQQEKGDEQDKGDQQDSGDKGDSGDGGAAGEKQGEGDKGDGEKSSDKQEGGEQSGDGENSSEGAGKGDAPSKRIDPMTNPGDAVDQIVQDTQQKQRQPQTGEQQQPGREQEPGEKQPGEKQPGDQPQPGEQQPGDQKQPGEQPQPGEKQTGEQSNQSEPGEQGEQPGEQGEKPGEQGEQSGGAGEPSNDANQGEGQQPGENSDSQSSDNPTAGEPGDMPPDDSGESTDKQPGANEKQPEASKPTDNEPTDDQQPGQEGGEGQGAQAQGSAKQEQKQQEEGAENTEAEGGDPQNEQGDAGSGRSTGQKKGSPAAHQQKQTRKKGQQSPGGDEQHEQDQSDPQASDDKRESDSSEGEDTGDRNGGGKEGGGQKADKPGTGGPGSNTEADEGEGEGNKAGEGNTANKGGNSTQSDGPTDGQSGEQAGNGSKQRAGGEKAGAAGDPQTDPNAPKKPRPPQAPQPGQPQDGAPPPAGGGTPDGDPGAPTTQGAGQQRPGGDGAPDAGPTRQNQQRDEPGGDDPNLEYARQATDLALNRLKDELAKDQPDPELLDKLGWSRDDMQQFVDRWDDMKARAREPGAKGEAARRRLDDELRNLGLRHRGTALSGEGGGKEKQHLRLREGRRSEPPPEYAEQYKAYTQGRAKGRKP